MNIVPAKNQYASIVIVSLHASVTILLIVLRLSKKVNTSILFQYHKYPHLIVLLSTEAISDFQPRAAQI